MISADYQGDTRFAGASANLDQEVDVAQTTTALTTSPNPSVFGQSVTVRAEVSADAPATGTPGGTVRFVIDGTTVGFVDLVNGVAEMQVSDLGVGDHTVRAIYLSTDPNFATSTSADVTQTVNKAPTKTVVTTSRLTVGLRSAGHLHRHRVGASLRASATRPGRSRSRTAPTSWARCPWSAAQASITTSSLSVAQHAITATYNGDGSFLGSNGSVTQKVNKAQTSTVVTSSANPSQSGQGVTFTATITPVAPGAGDPTGTVRFTVNGLPWVARGRCPTAWPRARSSPRCRPAPTRSRRRTAATGTS